jgi:DNA-directed RNA polymerase specialized sigma24 family protein
MSDEVEAEQRIRRLFDANDLDAAMTALVEAYGGELYGFLVGLGGDRARAEDAFGAACERMWKARPATTTRPTSNGAPRRCASATSASRAS